MHHKQVVKSNHIIEASYRLSVAEQRIILACIAQVRRDTPMTDEMLYCVSAHEIAELCGISLQTAYRDTCAAAERLFERRITLVRHPDGRQYKERHLTRWVQDVLYLEGEGCVKLRFSKSILPYLSELTSQFTKYALEDVAKMSSAYAIRLYELLVQWDSVGHREIELEQLRDWLQLEERYPSIKDFKLRVLEPAVEQINAHSPLQVSWTQRKEGRKVSHLIFDFALKVSKSAVSNKGSKLISEAELATLAQPGESVEQALRRLGRALIKT